MPQLTYQSSSSASTPAVATETPRPPLPPAMLQTLSARFREAGLFLIALAGDGAMVWYDIGANPLFLRYALPAFSRTGKTAGSIQSSDFLPGLLLTTIPCAQKRQSPGTLLLLARGGTPLSDETVLQRCGRLSLDSGWLMQQAQSLPAFDESTLRSFGGLLQEMVHDQVRARSIEGDLDKLSTQLSNSYEELNLIYQVSNGMKIDRRPEEFFSQACREVMEVISVRGMGYALEANFPGRPDPALIGELALAPEKFNRLSADLLSLLRGRVTPLFVNNLAADVRFKWLAGDVRCLLAVPLHREQKLLGCMIALDKIAGDFDSVDSKLVQSIANESSIYLENVRLFDDVHGLMMGLLHSLTSAVDAKDTYTCGHSERVALLSRHLAREAGLSDEDIEQVYMSGLLHDVGKIGVPEAVLQKAGKLTDEEFEQMKKHPQIGARILQDVPQLRSIIPGVLHHHEKWDGSGYPMKLAGQAIPLLGRIICLADCFDAMTSNRTYRAGRPFEAALAEIGACAGKHFDPELAAAFVRTSADGYRELLCEYQNKSRKLLEPRDLRRREAPITHGTSGR